MVKKTCLFVAAFTWAMVATAYGDDKQARQAYDQGDYATALSLWTTAAGQGDAHAQFRLGLMYENGIGVSRDDHHAARWYTESAMRNIGGAQFNLGLMYHEGRGVQRDPEQATKWYQRAESNGVTEAHYYLNTLRHFQSVLNTAALP